MQSITTEDLKTDLSYNSETGLFTRVNKRNHRFVAGQIAGCRHHTGYILVGFRKRSYLAHRLAWLYFYGEIPDSQIDHINRDRADNRIENLRLATPSENQQNTIENPRNTSGLKGVTWNARVRKWQSQIRSEGKTIYLGVFGDKDEAGEAYKKAVKKYHQRSPLFTEGIAA